MLSYKKCPRLDGSAGGSKKNFHEIAKVTVQKQIHIFSPSNLEPYFFVAFLPYCVAEAMQVSKIYYILFNIPKIIYKLLMFVRNESSENILNKCGQKCSAINAKLRMQTLLPPSPDRGEFELFFKQYGFATLLFFRLLTFQYYGQNLIFHDELQISSFDFLQMFHIKSQEISTQKTFQLCNSVNLLEVEFSLLLSVVVVNITHIPSSEDFSFVFEFRKQTKMGCAKKSAYRFCLFAKNICGFKYLVFGQCNFGVCCNPNPISKPFTIQHFIAFWTFYNCIFCRLYTSIALRIGKSTRVPLPTSHSID